MNDVLDQCYWDWCATPSHGDAKRIETKTLATGHFPLNVQENKGVDSAVIKQLKQLRKRLFPLPAFQKWDLGSSPII